MKAVKIIIEPPVFGILKLFYERNFIFVNIGVDK